MDTFRIDGKINEKPLARKSACVQNEYSACPKKGEHEK